MPATVSETHFASLLVNDTPLLDVRAPVEFKKGAFPCSTNIALLNDAEREQVGTAFKQCGQQAAIDLGHKLVSNASKQQRLDQWLHLLKKYPTLHIYCFRGGLRSHTVQAWYQEAGFEVPLIQGGFKALRNYLLKTLVDLPKQCDFVILAGKTGSAKTHLLNQLHPSLDLEGLANHRGSAFGNRVGGQPSQIDFENRLAIAALKLPFQKFQRLFIEDESRAIGSLSVHPALHKKMSLAPLAIIEETMENRVNTILNDYIVSNFREFRETDPNLAAQRFSDYLHSALNRIARRLGGENFAKTQGLVTAAITEQKRSGNTDKHRLWIEHLLGSYYDPMYEYQLGKKMQRLVFRGNRQEFLAWTSHIKCAKDATELRSATT